VQLERVLKKAKKGEDGRLHVTETTEWPYRIHGQLTMTYEDRTWGGSGVLIGPHHVLTAAHNVYDFDKKDWPTSWPTSISVRFGLNNTIAPFGTKKAVKVYTFKQWVNSGDQGYDMALLLLDSSIGRQIGWSGLLCLNDKEISKEKVTITGYPQGHSLQIEFMLYKTENLIK
jgi:V8-like Glu-specific endopeptidase